MKAVGTWHGLPRLTKSEWEDRIKEFDYRCGYCREKFDEDDLWLEHIVGIKEGGPHRIENVIPTCPKCNQQKGEKTLWEFKQLTVEELFQLMADHIAAIKAAESQ